jgi:hypothetical protein
MKRIPLFVWLAVFLASCTTMPLAGSDNFTDFTLQTGETEANETAEPERTQLSDNGEIVMLLRPLDENRIDIIGVDASCFADPTKCVVQTISHLPKNMPQVLKIYWLDEGIQGLFWDSDSGNIYTLDRFTGDIQLYQSKVLKTQNDFFFSPDGKSVLYDVQKTPFENEIVLLEVNSGDTQTLDIHVGGMKRIAEWLDNDKFLFWAENDSGQKGYLEDIQVYTFERSTQELQTVDLGMDWLAATPPYYSPDGKTFIISTKNSLLFFDQNNIKTKVVNLNQEKYLWSPDSTRLAVYTQENNILLLKKNSNEEKQIFSVPEDSVLSDWFWLPGNDDLLLVMCQVADGKTSLMKYSVSKDTFMSIDWPILSKENILSLSYRPSRNER